MPALTEVVQAPPDAPVPVFLEDELAQRVPQRIDHSLERRLREAIATVVLEQTRSPAPLLRQQVEAVVRDAVTQAIADEADAQRAQGIPLSSDS